MNLLLIPICFIERVTALDGKYVSFPWSGSSFDESKHAFGQAVGVQCIFDPNGPTLMEIMEQPGWHTGRIMKRHC
jgi:hypothetical protein